jgi:Holliday junction DNA helicase RuvA
VIGRIKGLLVEKQPPEILLEASGVGYEIQLPMTSFYPLPDVGEEVTIYTHFVVREDAQLLFGFINQQERSLFRELIKVNGVGPKLALTILSGMSASQFVGAVTIGDVSSLVNVPGIGKKTAERLLVEMRDKLDKLPHFSAEATPSNLSETNINPSVSQPDAIKEEALSALVALGYKPVQATKVVNSVYLIDMTSEDLIREALKSMV